MRKIPGIFLRVQNFGEMTGKQLTKRMETATITCVITIIPLLCVKGENHGKESNRYENNDT